MAGGQHHAFAHAELHLARCQVGNQHGEFALEVFGLVGTGDAAEDIAQPWLAVGVFFTGIQCQAQQLGRALNLFAVDDSGNTQVNFAEVVDGDVGR